MAPKRKGLSVNLRDLQREMGVSAAMLLPSAPKPVEEGAAERSRYGGGGKDGMGDRFGGGGGAGGGSGVRWADRDSDDDDEWRRDDEGQANGVAPRNQRSQPSPDVPEEPWRSSHPPRPCGGGVGGDSSGGRGGGGGGGYQRGDSAAGAADEDWGVLRSAPRGSGGPGSRGDGDSFRGGGGGAVEEDVDFSEVRRGGGSAQQQRKQSHHLGGGGAAAADQEHTLDFAALRSARSGERPHRSGGGGATGDDRPEHLRSLRTRLAEKAAERAHQQQHQQEAAVCHSTAGVGGGGVALPGAAVSKIPAPAEHVIEGSAGPSSPAVGIRGVSAVPSSPALASGTTGMAGGLSSRTSSLGCLGQVTADGSSRPARYVPPSKRAAAAGGLAAGGGGGVAAAASGGGGAGTGVSAGGSGGAAINSRAAVFVHEDERRKFHGSARATGLASPASGPVVRGLTAPASTGGGGSTSTNTAAVASTLHAPIGGPLLTPVPDVAACLETMAGNGENVDENTLPKPPQEKEDDRSKEGRASTAATLAAVSPSLAGTSPRVATPMSRGSLSGIAGAPPPPPPPPLPTVTAAAPATACDLGPTGAADVAALAAGGAGGPAGETQKALPRWKQRLEQRLREHEAAAAVGGASSGACGVGGGLTAGPSARERSAGAAAGTPHGGGGAVSTGSGEGGSGGAAGSGSSLSSSIGVSHQANALLHEEVVQLQPIRLGSGTRRPESGTGGGREGKFIPPSLRQQQQHHGGGLSALSASLTKGSSSDVQRLFLQAAAAAAGNRRGGGNQMGAGGPVGPAGDKRKSGTASNSTQSDTAAGAEEEDQKRKQKKERELQREKQKQAALERERERREKAWKHEESEVHAFVELLEETLASLAEQDLPAEQRATRREKEKREFQDSTHQQLEGDKEETGGAHHAEAEQNKEAHEENREEKRKDEQIEEEEQRHQEKELCLRERQQKQRQRLVLSKEEGGVLSEETLRGMIPSLVVAAALMKRCMQKREMEEVREEVQRASALWKELYEKSEVEEKDQVLIREMARAVSALKCPRLSPSVSLIEAMWDAMVATQVLPDTAFIQWFDDAQDESCGRTEVLFQVVDWCLWLQGDLSLHNTQEDFEDDAEEEDVEALVPKRGGQKVGK